MKGPAKLAEECVRVEIPIGSPEDVEAARNLSERLSAVLDESSVGEYDGHGAGRDMFDIFLYARSADELASYIWEIVSGSQMPAGSVLIKQYGPPGAEEMRILISDM